MSVLAGRLKDPTLLRTQAFIDGAWVDADPGATVPIQNPAAGETIASVARCGTAETRRAILAAARAQVGWRKLTAKTRSDLLRRWFNLMMANQHDLAEILTAEMGKPLSAARRRKWCRGKDLNLHGVAPTST